MRGPDGLGARFTRDLPSPVPAHPLDALLTAERARKYRQVLARRTARLAVVVEDCHDPHNATAVVRTCDALGIHRVFVTTGRNSFKVNRSVSQGSHHWVDLRVHADIAAAYADARALGYRLWVTDLHADAVLGPQRLAGRLAEGPIALVFGSESDGVSRAASEQADGRVLIPMAGFPQSLNLSVSVAISLYALRGEALADDLPGDLPAAEQAAIYDRWARAHTGEKGERFLRQTTGSRGEPLDEYQA